MQDLWLFLTLHILTSTKWQGLTLFLKPLENFRVLHFLIDLNFESVLALNIARNQIVSKVESRLKIHFNCLANRS